MSTEVERRRYAESIAKQLAEKGKLVEGGWQAFEHFYLRDVPADQVERLRLAFYMGSQHLWAALYMTLEEDGRDGPAELRRLAAVHAELDAFEMELRSGHKAGRA